MNPPDITPEDFRTRLRSDGADAIVDNLILSAGAKHVTDESIGFIANKLAVKFGISQAEVSLSVVGSAKLGFSIHYKKLQDGIVLARYRPFGPTSDIDIAVVSRPIFDQVWNDISAYAHTFSQFPWNSGRLGDYLIFGWWRPDKFPREVRIPSCDDWSDCFRSLSRDRRFGYKKVRGGLFYSRDHLRRYYLRDVVDCVKEEELAI
jgi:hypothetical protein